MKRLIQEITTFVLGTRCYAVIIGERGSDRYDIASQIHFTKASAEEHRRRVEQTRTFVYITTVSFRWRSFIDKLLLFFKEEIRWTPEVSFP